MKQAGLVFGLWVSLLMGGIACGGMVYQGVKGPKSVRDFNESIKLDTERTKALAEHTKALTEQAEAQTKLTEEYRKLSESNNRVAAATIQLTEWLDAQERRFADSGKRVSP